MVEAIVILSMLLAVFVLLWLDERHDAKFWYEDSEKWFNKNLEGIRERGELRNKLSRIRKEAE